MRRGRSGVIYAGSREGTEQLAERLAQAGVPALAYHAGIDKAVRNQRLHTFLEAEENTQPARRLYAGSGFPVVARRERYYKQPDGEQLNALLMRRDLS